MSSVARLQVVCAWQRRLLGYRLLAPRDSLWVGPSKRADFACPQFEAAPPALRLCRPARGGGFVLRLAPGMTGHIESQSRGKLDVQQLLAEPVVKRFGNPRLRDVELWPGDAAVIYVADSNLRFQLAFVDPPEILPRPTPRDGNPFFYRVLGSTAVVLGVAVALLMILGPTQVPDSAISEERFAKVLEPELLNPKVQQAREQVKKHGEKRKQDKQAAESKRAKDKQGRLGRQDAKGETTLPKGEKDILRDKVANTGVLALLGKAKAGGSGLGKLLNDDNANDLDQAVTGLAGAQLAVGKGEGGLGTAGTGLGGGGTGFGNIQGSGNLAVGAGRGKGRSGPGLGTGKEKAVSVGLSTGSPDADGGLTKDQINRVVMAHKAALKYCYEKELQRKPSLEGKVELFWVIDAGGEVQKVKVAASTMSDAEVESCMQRQVKNWRFPKATAPTIVSRYPFLFKGGA